MTTVKKFGEKGYKAVQGTNRDYLSLSRAPYSRCYRVHELILVPPVGGSLSDKAHNNKSAGFKIVIQYMPEIHQRSFLNPGKNPWLVEIRHIKVYGCMTMAMRLPKGIKSGTLFQTLTEAKTYALKVKHALEGLKKK
jgi:hypothetical protein